MHWLMKVNGICDVIEVGPFRGLSACFWATAIKGSVYTINVSKEEINDAKALSNYLGISNIIFIEGDSLEVLPELCQKLPNLHVAYLDVNHSFRYAAGEYSIVKPFLENRPRSAVIFDDADYIHPDGNEDGGVPRIVNKLGLSLVENYGIAIKTFGAFDAILTV